MSHHSRIKHFTATLATAACLAFATGVGAVEPTDEQPLFQMAGTVCHPAYRACQKESPRPATTRSASAATAYIAIGEFDYVPFGSVCHPAYRPCANWSRVEKSTN
jgi:hypothetical protein